MYGRPQRRGPSADDCNLARWHRHAAHEVASGLRIGLIPADFVESLRCPHGFPVMRVARHTPDRTQLVRFVSRPFAKHLRNSRNGDPEIDAWYAQQAKERDRKQRTALLHQIQQKLYDEVRFIPIWDLGALHASGPRVAVSGIGLIPLFAFSGPCEDVRLKS